MCTWVGNQRSCGVVTAPVRTDAVRSLYHQRRDLHQSTYPYLSEDWDSSYYHVEVTRVVEGCLHQGLLERGVSVGVTRGGASVSAVAEGGGGA
jgi:hypothetical protein